MTNPINQGLRFEHGDILRVTPPARRSFVANYIRGDANTITVNPDPYNERGEITYKRSDVRVEVIGPASRAIGD